MSDTPPPGDRIAKILARAGIASRREAERMIEAGRVAVNGKVIGSAALNVTGADRIEVDGKPLAAPEPPRLWLYHKPAGLVTSARDEQGRRTVFDALPAGMPRVMSVGRLDLNSEGLLLLTNDGAIKRRLELPSTGWLRRYRVRVKGTPDEALLAPLRAGMEIDGERYQPMEVVMDRQQGANAWLTLGLREGRNREIRRVMEHVGLIVNRLIRVSYGPFQLGNLAAGEVSEVKGRVLRDQLGLEPDAPAGAPPPKPGRGGKPGQGGKPGSNPGKKDGGGRGGAADTMARRPGGGGSGRGARSGPDDETRAAAGAAPKPHGKARGRGGAKPDMWQGGKPDAGRGGKTGVRRDGKPGPRGRGGGATRPKRS